MLGKALTNGLRTFFVAQRARMYLFSSLWLNKITFISITEVARMSSTAAKHHDPNPGLAETKHGRKESEEEFDNRYVAFFNRPDLDSWLLRKGIADLHCMDQIPEPKIIIAALEAARRLNDHSICVRFLEAIQWKAQGYKNIYPYILQEIRPTLDKLGISTPEELGYDKPELALPDPFF